MRESREGTKRPAKCPTGAGKLARHRNAVDEVVFGFGRSPEECQEAVAAHRTVCTETQSCVSRSRAVGAERVSRSRAAVAGRDCRRSSSSKKRRLVRQRRRESRRRRRCNHSVSKELVADSARKRRRKKSARGKKKRNDWTKRNVQPRRGATWRKKQEGHEDRKKDGRQTTRSREAHEALNCHTEVIFQLDLYFCKRVDVDWTTAKRHCLWKCPHSLLCNTTFIVRL